jgi:hypothetical protein
MDFEQDYLRQ